jgi:hypothetical protein
MVLSLLIGRYLGSLNTLPFYVADFGVNKFYEELQKFKLLETFLSLQIITYGCHT